MTVISKQTYIRTQSRNLYPCLQAKKILGGEIVHMTRVQATWSLRGAAAWRLSPPLLGMHTSKTVANAMVPQGVEYTIGDKEGPVTHLSSTNGAGSPI